MTIGILVLSDQLNQRHAVLPLLEERFGASDARRHCRVLLIESSAPLDPMPLHRQRLVLLWSGLRHFVAELSNIWACEQRHEPRPLASRLANSVRSSGVAASHSLRARRAASFLCTAVSPSAFAAFATLHMNERLSMRLLGTSV